MDAGKLVKREKPAETEKNGKPPQMVPERRSQSF